MAPKLVDSSSTAEASTIPTEGHAIASDPHTIPTEGHAMASGPHTKSPKDANFYQVVYPQDTRRSRDSTRRLILRTMRLYVVTKASIDHRVV
jgi:hypothetical protein